MNPRLRYLWRWSEAFLKRFKGLLFLGVVIGILIFLIIRIFIPYFLKFASSSVGYTGMYRSDELPDKIKGLISYGLTRTNDKGELEPGLATFWESPDQGKTWIFHLNENLKWQDGKKIESTDIIYDFKDVTVERPDTKTIIFKLKDKFSPFPYAASKPLFKRGLMGAGEWKVKNIKLEKEYVTYLKIVNPEGQQVTYRFYPNEERAKLALKLGRVKKLEEIYNLSPFETWKTMRVVLHSDNNQVITLFFNNKSSLLSDKTFRQALNYAIDKEAANLERAIGPISPISWVFNPQVKNYNYDFNKAKEIAVNILNDKNKERKINLYTTPTLLPIAEKIAKDWDKIGVNSNIVVTSIIPSEFDAFLAILDIPKDPDQYSLWHSTQTTSNISKYSSQRIDKLLEDGRAELNLEERRKIYLDFQRFLVEDCPAIFLYHPTVYTIERK